MNYPNVALINDRILVKVDEAETVSAGGIVLPGADKQKESRGTVVAVGPGRWSDPVHRRVPMVVQIGHYVTFSKYVGTQVKLDGIDYLSMREDDVIAVLESR